MQDGLENTRKYEAAVYNQQVRDYEKDGRVHPSFDSSWADLNFFTIESTSKDEVVRLIEKKYPPRKGFVISDIIEVREFEFVRPAGVPRF